MFVVDAAVLLPYPPHVVARVVERLHALPRWCTGLRRVRHPAPELLPSGEAAPDCVFTYAAADGRFTLRARTAARPAAGGAGEARHAAAGDGVAFVWRYEAEPAVGGAATRTRLRARTEVSVDPAHPTAAVRAALCRQVARRAPVDLERLRALIERYEAGKPRARLAGAAAATGPAADAAAGAPVAGPDVAPPSDVE